MKFIYHFCKSPMEGEEIKAESAQWGKSETAEENERERERERGGREEGKKGQEEKREKVRQRLFTFDLSR